MFLNLLLSRITPKNIMLIMATIMIFSLMLTFWKYGKDSANLDHQTNQVEILENEMHKTIQAQRIEDAILQRSPDDDVKWLRENDYIRRED